MLAGAVGGTFRYAKQGGKNGRWIDHVEMQDVVGWGKDDPGMKGHKGNSG